MLVRHTMFTSHWVVTFFFIVLTFKQLSLRMTHSQRWKKVSLELQNRVRPLRGKKRGNKLKIACEISVPLPPPPPKRGQCSATKKTRYGSSPQVSLGSATSAYLCASQISLASELNTGGSKTKPACKYIIKTNPCQNTAVLCWLWR